MPFVAGDRTPPFYCGLRVAIRLAVAAVVARAVIVIYNVVAP